MNIIKVGNQIINLDLVVEVLFVPSKPTITIDGEQIETPEIRLYSVAEDEEDLGKFSFFEGITAEDIWTYLCNQSYHIYVPPESE